jgi:hypothetical protein
MKNKKTLVLLQRIIKQAVEISSNSIIDVFTDFSSHVHLFSIKVYLEGWNPEKDSDYRKDVWLNIYSEDKCNEDLEEIIKYLEEVRK